MGQPTLPLSQLSPVDREGEGGWRLFRRLRWAHRRNTKRGGGVADRVTTDRQLSPVVLKVSHKVGHAYISRREGKANGRHH